MLNCRATTQLLSESLDRELSLSDRINLKIHTMMCFGCRNFGHQMHVLRGASEQYAQGNVPTEEEKTNAGGSNA